MAAVVTKEDLYEVQSHTYHALQGGKTPRPWAEQPTRAPLASARPLIDAIYRTATRGRASSSRRRRAATRERRATMETRCPIDDVETEENDAGAQEEIEGE